jgi:LysM repeat protein
MTVSNTIDSYRKRRKKPLPLILGGVAVLLVVVGIIILIVTMSRGGFTLFSTQTPTPTITPNPTNTYTPTQTPTISLTPTITPTATASQIYQYVVKEGETLTTIIQSQGLADTPNALVIIYMLNPTIDPISGFITVGQTINLPPPNYPIPSPTPLPTGLAPGAKITYRVLPGDSLNSIATRFNSTAAQIVLDNKAALPNGTASLIYPGQMLVVSINIVTPVPTVKPTATATP